MGSCASLKISKFGLEMLKSRRKESKKIDLHCSKVICLSLSNSWNARGKKNLESCQVMRVPSFDQIPKAIFFA